MNENIIWIASYPKSGNTMVRVFLSSYFFTKDGILEDFSILKNINNFNNLGNFNRIEHFPKLEYFIKNPLEISKYWKEAQQNIKDYFKNNIIFLKTHNAQIKFNSNQFTNTQLTKAFIYIVRDPRSVLLSSISHYGYSNQCEAKEKMISDKRLSYANSNGTLPEFLLSWKTNYLSWHNFLKINPLLGHIVRYEDLLSVNKNEYFYKILDFICSKNNQKINMEKFNNAVESTSFQKLQNIEKKDGFSEKSNNSNSFFRSGTTNEWVEKLDKNIIDEINNIFYKEMKLFQYL